MELIFDAIVCLRDSGWTKDQVKALIREIQKAAQDPEHRNCKITPPHLMMAPVVPGRNPPIGGSWET